MFTSEEALEFQGTEDAVMLSWDRVTDICNEHDASVTDFMTECVKFCDPGNHTHDAGDLFAWLGY